MIKKVPGAGVILLARFNYEVRYLLLCDKYALWDFPKGKLEEDDQDQLRPAALRELAEETKIEGIGLDPEFETITQFSHRAGNGLFIKKRVTFFLSVVDFQPEVTLSEEHRDKRFALFEEAEALLQEQSQRALRSARDYFLRVYS